MKEPKPKKEAGNTTVINGDKVSFENGKLKIPQQQKTAPMKKEKKSSKRKIECIKCHAHKGISKRRMEWNLKKFPNEESFRAQYLCRDCRTELKKQKKNKGKK